LGREEPDEVQPGQGQGPAPGEEQPQAPAQAGAELLESSSAERDLGVLPVALVTGGFSLQERSRCLESAWQGLPYVVAW